MMHIVGDRLCTVWPNARRALYFCKVQAKGLAVSILLTADAVNCVLPGGL